MFHAHEREWNKELRSVAFGCAERSSPLRFELGGEGCDSAPALDADVHENRLI